MKLFNLTGKVALITGGNGGIGLAMAKAIGEAGASVIIAGRNENKNNESIENTKCLVSVPHGLILSKTKLRIRDW